MIIINKEKLIIQLIRIDEALKLQSNFITLNIHVKFKTILITNQ